MYKLSSLNNWTIAQLEQSYGTKQKDQSLKSTSEIPMTSDHISLKEHKTPIATPIPKQTIKYMSPVIRDVSKTS